jgi:acyl-CoA synthetase (AMP-forming)/AMP-acid ligase II
MVARGDRRAGLTLKPELRCERVQAGTMPRTAASGRSPPTAGCTPATSAWKHPRDLIVVERVPRTPNGKLARRELIERERTAASSAV